MVVVIVGDQDEVELRQLPAGQGRGAVTAHDAGERRGVAENRIGQEPFAAQLEDQARMAEPRDGKLRRFGGKGAAVARQDGSSRSGAFSEENRKRHMPPEDATFFRSSVTGS